MNINIFRILLLSSILSFFSVGCKTSKGPEKPLETYTPAVVEPPQVSALSIPIKIPVVDIERLINSKLAGIVYEDNNLDDDGLMVRATKSQPIKINAEGLTFTYRVPLKIWLRKSVAFSSVDAEGEIALTFKTQFNINPDWSTATKTEVTTYEWIKPPVLKMGVELPIKYIANTLLEQSKTMLATTLDQQFASQIDMKVAMRDAWATLQNPIMMSEEFRMWMKLTPQSVSMTPLTNRNGVLESTVTVDSYSDVTMGDKPLFRANSPLPPFRLVSRALSDSFRININTDVPFTEAERLARQFMVGQEFTNAGKKVTVTGLEIFGQGDKMVINTFLSGAYNGSIYLVGKPVFKPETNSIVMENLDFELNTKNFLLKGAKWLFNRAIIDKMQKAMIFPLDENVGMIKNTVQEQLNNYQIAKGIFVNGTVNDVRVQKVYITSDGINVRIGSSGKLAVNVNGLE